MLTPDPEPPELVVHPDAPASIPEVVDLDGHPLGWSIREVRHLRFLRCLAEREGRRVAGEESR